MDGIVRDALPPVPIRARKWHGRLAREAHTEKIMPQGRTGEDAGATLKAARPWGCPGCFQDTPKPSEWLEGGTPENNPVNPVQQ